MHFFSHLFAKAFIGLAATSTLVFAPAAIAHDKPKNTGIVPPAMTQHAEIHITQNGKVLLRDATVTAVNGNTITANVSFGPAVFTWTITTASTTRFAGSNNGTLASTTPVAVGNVLSIDGWLGSTTQPTVAANVIKDFSLLGAVKSGDDSDHDNDKDHGNGKK